ncbi:MAG: Holliday junction resolvase RuvX [Bacteroidetes bacterium]|nr:MAG: Holliday junction resolvase RuvX [Bacteroidota bacterium]REK08038.1 MAG: Holliday junction resolvase RuvX [Bacteroidota bacterium]REK32243.1 MAG: Holliday junction resolvase RuvX [Bacteroidota bacterium]REK47395.1 MAG: Holliday junction resolvase RuvX [Bacteroidota bacterium]
MPRIMAIDYGLKRVGLAVTDPNRIIASALDTVPSHEAISFISNYCEKESVECFVVGEPKQMDYTPSEITPHIEAFIKQLKKKFPDIRVERVDERFSSKIAAQAILMSGVKKMQRRNKSLVDQTSAVILLQSWMEANSN